MSIGFYMDEHTDPAISTGLTAPGIDVLTVQQDGLISAPDEQLLDRATVLIRVIVTQDEDFLIEAHRRHTAGEPFAGVIYFKQNTLGIGAVVFDLEIVGKVFEPEDIVNQIVYLPL